ncbi:MAG: phytanoyl-CoA dioxygenase family protein [Terriglobia bacterium]
MTSDGKKKLSASQQQAYRERGYHYPVRVFGASETEKFRGHFQDYLSRNRERISGLPPREHYIVMTQTHLLLRWVFQMVSHPKVLDAVESVLGPNLMVWSSQWFPKMPGDKTYISWHQDATYWGLRPPNVTTAWIALSESCPENGCMRVIPGSQDGPLLPQMETYAQDNALSRGQEIAVAVEESRAVDLVLQPGEMSLHHIGIVHGSNANKSEKPRIGLAVRFITPEVVQDGDARPIVLLVRGKDEFGHFDVVDPPQDDVISSQATELHQEALRRQRTNIMPKGSKRP